MTQTPLITPTYDRTDLKPRILHLGFGAFARAHTLLFNELALEHGGDWGVVVARLNSGAQALSTLAQANHLYTVAESDDAGTTARRVGCITGTCHPLRDGADALPNLIASTDMSIISLTITEKGYCLSAGQLDQTNPGIQHDLSNLSAPQTAIGIMVEGLHRRRAAGHSGITILSCDNLPSNGALCRHAVLEFAKLRDPDLARWIADTCTFPATMVDRIVPALDDAGRALLRETLGQDDPNGIVCEPFRQWVIEDDFAADRPNWERAGAEFVTNVEPFEEMKLRMLNGSHSFLAYLGALAGHATIADCMDDKLFKQAAQQLMIREQAPTLTVPETVDLEGYANRLIARYGNSKLHHKTTQIAMDGSQKLPQRLLAPISENLQAGRNWPLAALGVAGWMRYLRGCDDNGDDLPLSDPLADDLIRAAQGRDGEEFVEALLADNRIFPATLAENSDFQTAVLSAYGAITATGPRAAIAAVLEPSS